MSTPDPVGYVRLTASVPLHADPEAVVAALRSGPSGWEERPSVPGYHRYAVDLRLRLGGDAAGLTTFRKAAYVDVGWVRPAEDAGYVAEISWRATTAAPLFPVFSGELRVGAEALTVNGLYAPPGGAAGMLADRALLHVAANGTARWLLREIDRVALGAAA
ncbi:MAG: hypothetical protein M3Y40_06785 [Chloroflexota bacterium]|nr:hypothetical protein [Chloroflexota bacterium]